MIFIDSSEKNTNLPVEHFTFDFTWLDNLEELTGADIMVTVEDAPAPTTMRRIQYHLSQGAFLIQVKIGLDIASSVGTRLHNSLYQMRETGAKLPQCILLCVGIVSCRDGMAYVNGRECIPPKNYWAVVNSLNRWCDRGGAVHYLHREALIEDYLVGRQRDVKAYVEEYVKEAWPTKRDYPDDPGDVLQVLVPVRDWRVTLRNAPKLGLGPKKLNALAIEMAKAGEPDTLWAALTWLTRDDKPKVPGIGKGIKQKVKDHIGMEEGQNIVMTPHFPTTLIFPPNAKVGVVHNWWKKLPDGRIQARYESREQLALCIAAVGEHKPEIWEAIGVEL